MNSKENFHDQVMIPAARLMAKIQLSTSSYSLWLREDPFVDVAPLKFENLVNGRFVDLKSRKLLKRGAVVGTNDNENTARIILPLQPGLRRNNDGRNATILRDQTFLVSVEHPLKQRQQISRPILKPAASAQASKSLLD